MRRSVVNARALYTALGVALIGLALAAVFSAYLPLAIALALTGLALVLVGQTKHRHHRRRGRY